MGLAASGAATVAAACPFCQSMLRDALGAMPNPPRLLDIAQITANQIASATSAAAPAASTGATNV